MINIECVTIYFSYLSRIHYSSLSLRYLWVEFLLLILLLPYSHASDMQALFHISTVSALHLPSLLPILMRSSFILIAERYIHTDYWQFKLLRSSLTKIGVLSSQESSVLLLRCKKMKEKEWNVLGLLVDSS